MEKLEEFWVQQDFKKRLSLRPYLFHSFSYKDKTDRAFSRLRIKATDKNGLIHTFRLEAIWKIKKDWKIFYDDLTDLRDAYMVQSSI